MPTLKKTSSRVLMTINLKLQTSMSLRNCLAKKKLQKSTAGGSKNNKIRSLMPYMMPNSHKISKR
jgi:hypothetical protein